MATLIIGLVLWLVKFLTYLMAGILVGSAAIALIMPQPGMSRIQTFFLCVSIMVDLLRLKGPWGD